MLINLWMSNKAEHLDHLWNCQLLNNFSAVLCWLISCLKNTHTHTHTHTHTSSVNVYHFISMHFVWIFLVILFSLYFQSRKKAKKGDNLDDLKQELDIDFHKISLEQLYQRFSTNPDTVSMTVQQTLNCCSLCFYCTECMFVPLYILCLVLCVHC